MKKNNAVLKDFSRMLEKRFPGKSEKIMEDAWREYEKLLSENPDESKSLKAHTVKMIYPVIGVYRALQTNGTDKKTAEKIIDECCSERAEPQAQMIRNSLKIPGLYKLMPKIFKWMTVNNFGEAAGFKAEFYDTDKNMCKFDMTHCVYNEICTKNGCPEIVKAFCHTDDVTDGNMHPKIKWHRTKTIGEGGDCCDFQITVEE